MTELAELVGIRAACRMTEVSRPSWYRHHNEMLDLRDRPDRRRSPRILSTAERQTILDVAHEPRFADASIPEMYATLLDEGRYLGSLSTFYRVLHSAGEVYERRRHATHPPTIKPELCAMGPKEVWSWDITKLRGPQKWTWFYLYVLIDIFSRYVVGWMVADRESSELARELIGDHDRARRDRSGHPDHPRRSRKFDGFQTRGVPAR